MLVLRFHRTLATPEPLRDSFQSTISTKDRTQGWVLAVYNGIRNLINRKLLYEFIQKKLYNICKNSLSFNYVQKATISPAL